MKILVTGGSGFIGSHLVERLRKEKHEVTVIDKKPSISNFVWTVDVSDGTQVDRFFKSGMCDFDIIYHLAAKPWTKVSNEAEWLRESKDIFETNAIGTYNLIKNCGDAIFVFASTANVYGSGRKLKETSPVNISSPYGYSKSVAEQIITSSMKRHVIYRFGTVVGRRGRCFPNRLVWMAVNEKPVEIWGAGEHLRDIIDVRDLVSCLNISKELPNGMYNVASGKEYDKIELVKITKRISAERGHKFEYSYVAGEPAGYVPESTLNISRILSSCLWRPKIGLKETIEDLFDYYEKAKKAPVPPRWDEV